MGLYSGNQYLDPGDITQLNVCHVVSIVIKNENTIAINLRTHPHESSCVYFSVLQTWLSQKIMVLKMVIYGDFMV